MPQIVCPSGLAGEIRKLKVREENLLADVKKTRAGKAMNEVLENIWLETHDPGPYKIDAGGKPDWSKVLIGDHFYAILRMRVVTFGNAYVFGVQCTNQFCRAPFQWEVDLEELDVKKLSDEDRDRFVSGNTFEAFIPSSKKKVMFQLLLAEAQRKFVMARRQDSGALSSAALRFQIKEIDGVKKNQLGQFIDDMDSDDADSLRAQFDACGCGVETGIQIECPECGTIGEIDLPFGGKEFFTRKRVKVQSKLEMVQDLKAALPTKEEPSGT